MNDTSMHPPEPTVASWGAPAPAAPVAGAFATPAFAASGVESASRPGRRKRGIGGKGLIIAVVAVLVFVVPSVMSSMSNGNGVSLGSYASTTGSSGSSDVNSAGAATGGSNDYSSYYGQTLNADSYSSRWPRDGTFHTESGTYDGPYDYSGYGVDGMKARAKGLAVDPLVSSDASLPDVFDQYGVGSTDPLNGAPATARGSAAGPNPVNPYYDPWATQKQNPYQNRLDLSFGSASSRSAWLDGTDLADNGY